jgi:hypothetical protein
VNEAAAALGSPQKDYRNMLDQALQWGHDVIVWDHPARGGRVYKLIYDPNHTGPGSVDPPADWRDNNVPKVPASATSRPYRRTDCTDLGGGNPLSRRSE